MSLDPFTVGTLVVNQAEHCLTEAMRLAEHGYFLTPVTLTRLPDGNKGTAFHKNWKRDSKGVSNDPDQVRDWWSIWPDTSFAVVCGPSEVEVVDLDVKNDIDGIGWWAERNLPTGSMVVSTPSGGLHHYWRMRAERRLPVRAGDIAPNVDTRSIGGIAFAPGSYVLGEARGYEVIGEMRAADGLDSTPNAVLDLVPIPTVKDHPTDGEITLHDKPWMLRQFDTHLATVSAKPPSGFRQVLRDAAGTGGRLVDAGVLSQEAVTSKLRAAVTAAYPNGPDADDEEWIREAQVSYVRLGRWRVTDDPLMTGWLPEESAKGSRNPARVHVEPSGSSDSSGSSGFFGDSRRLVLTRASSIRPERQRWLWTDRLPLAALTLIAGREGLGKSTIADDLGAQITRGDLGGEFKGQARDVLIVATEDNKATTIVPRLIAAKADMDRVHFVTAEMDGLTGQPIFPLDTAPLGEVIAQTTAALVILDAATSVIDGKLDGDRDRQMRQALEPLGRLAAEHDCAVVGIVHFGKRADSDTGKLILGSIAWSQVARAVLTVARDEDSGHLLIQPTKANLSPGDTKALLVKLVPASVATDDGPTSVGRVEWLGETDAQAIDHLGRRDDPDDRNDRDEAAEWLTAYLRGQGGQAGAGQVIKAAGQDGIAKTTLTRARHSVCVRTVKNGMHGGWVWQLDPRRIHEEPEESTCTRAGPFGPFVDSSAQADDPESLHEPPTPPCEECREPLLLIRPGRTKCARCAP